MRSLAAVLFVALALFVSVGAAEAQSARFDNFPEAQPKAGEIAPPFTLMTLDGEPFSLHEAAADKPVLPEFGSFT